MRKSAPLNSMNPTTNELPKPTELVDAPTPEADASIMYASAFGPPAKNPFTRVVPLHVARRLERERNKYKAWNEESKANAHRALSHADRELVEARAEAARLRALLERADIELLRESQDYVRDGLAADIEEALAAGRQSNAKP
jgi:hypothetical protein